MLLGIEWKARLEFLNSTVFVCFTKIYFQTYNLKTSCELLVVWGRERERERESERRRERNVVGNKSYFTYFLWKGTKMENPT